MGNFDSYLNAGRSEYFKMETRNSENNLIGGLITGAINERGVCFRYYVKSMDINADKIHGEDVNGSYSRTFTFMGIYSEVPPENRLFKVIGIEMSDELIVHASKQHFAITSKVNGHGDEYLPVAGDIIETEYNNMLYEIQSVPVMTEFNYFQSTNLVWEFVVRPYVRNHYHNTDGIAGTTLSTVNGDSSDIFDVSGLMEVLSDTVKYEPTQTEQNQANPFSSW